MKKFAPLALALFALPLAAGCGGPTDGASADDVADLKAEVAKLEKEKSALESRLKGLERRLDGTARDIASLHNSKPAAGAAAAVESVAADAAEAVEAASDEAKAAMTPAAKAFDDFLKTESGQDALSTAIEQANRRRERQRWSRMAEGMIERFAEEANLSEDQSKRMKELSAGMMEKMGDAFAAMRGDENSTPEERAEARAAAMEQMGQLREQMNEDVKLILDAEQYSMYEERMSRMRGFGGGGRGMGGGRRGR